LSKIKKLILVEDAGAMIPAAGATCYVYHATTLTLAQMYTDRNGSVLASNPATIGSTGYLDRYIESGAYDLRVVSGLDETTYPDFLAVDDIIISGPSGELQFSDIANLKAATPLNQKSYKVNWAGQIGRKVSTVVDNTTSNAGGADYVITNVNPGNLSTLVGGIWVGANHDLGGGFYAKKLVNQIDLDLNDLESELSETITENKLEIDTRQNWFDVVNKTKTASDARILVQRATGSFDRIFVFINHKSNFYQRWELTRGGGTGDGFDNSVTTHPNGNMWFVNKVDHVLVGPMEEVEATSVDMTKVGTTLTSGSDVRFASGYAECTVFGTVVYLNYVARNDAGIANVYVDGILVGTLDQYSTSSGGVLTASKIAEGLANADHVIRIEHTGTQNPSSSNDYIRVRSIVGVGLQDYDNVASFGVYTAAMTNGSSTFKIGSAASELAIQSTLAGSTVWSGAYHKYCYPKVSDNQVIHIDGLLVDFSDMVSGDLVLCNSVRLVQALELSNVDDPIADLTMQHYFTSDGCNVKFTLEWTAVVDVSRSYQAMWPTQAESAVLGGMQGRYVADYDNANINVFKKSFNAIAYNNTNEWISGFKSNNEYGANWPNAGYAGLYIWDRPTDFKIYMRKFSGETTIGDVWLSDVQFTIGHCPNPNDVLMLPTIPT
jgi:hypothetical protein